METALSFNQVQFDVVDRNGAPWFQARQIGEALGYSRSDAILNIYDRNKDEFTIDMTTTIELMVGSTPQKTRIFSLRGCHLLAMFARTPVAKEFRKWVLDVLDRIAREESMQAGKERASDLITVSEQKILQTLGNAISDRYPSNKQNSATMRLWMKFRLHFGVTSYKNLPASRMIEAVTWLVNYEIQEKELPCTAVKTKSKAASGIDPEMTGNLREVLTGIYEMQEQCDKYINHIYAYIGSNVIRMNADASKQNLFHALVHLKRTSMDGLHMAKDSLLTLWSLGKGVSFI